jgi:prevent-host-death family protein
MYEAKTHLSKLVQRALDGEEVIVAKAGVGLIRLTPLQKQPSSGWIGCMADQGFSVPKDFNEMGRAEIEEMFYGEPDKAERAALKKAKRRAR